MNETVDKDELDAQLAQIESALARGLIVVDPSGQIVWMDQNARRLINGGLAELSFPLVRGDRQGIDCFLTPIAVPGDRAGTTVCVVQAVADREETGHDLVAAIEAVLSDSSWFTRTIIEKLKAWRQTKRPSARSSDLDMLTHREREILALICAGKSDAEMGRMLNLSQNTVRNHVASLYRKIGVNRRSAAIIWARERAITIGDLTAARRRPSQGRALDGPLGREH